MFVVKFTAEEILTCWNVHCYFLSIHRTQLSEKNARLEKQTKMVANSETNLRDDIYIQNFIVV